VRTNDWPGRERAESLRQWPVIEGLATRAAEIDAVDGVILLGSFARGDPDELSDVDALLVVAPGRFQDVWAERGRLSDGALIAWDGEGGQRDLEWHTWLTRDVVKVECGIVDPDSGSRDLADPCVVLLGDPSLVERFPRISQGTLAERTRKQTAEQVAPASWDELTAGELIAWKISELKDAVRSGLREDRGKS
jgi:predicted nucleotidyltransferase